MSTAYTTGAMAWMRRRVSVGIAGLLIGAGGLGGCVSSYAVDVRNQTSQPLYVQLLQRPGSGGEPVLGTMRMGPGDRGAIGPAQAKTGYAYVQLDTKPNKGEPVTMDLPPGVTILEITQTGEGNDGQLQVRQIGE